MSYRIVFHKLPINVFDNTSTYWIRLFLNNPEATVNTPLKDPSYAGHIVMYNNSAHAFDCSTDSKSNDPQYITAGTDVTATVERLGLQNSNLSASDFRVVVVQHGQEVAPSAELQPLFKPELVKC